MPLDTSEAIFEVPDWLRNANEYAVVLIRSGKMAAAEVTLNRTLALAPNSYELWTNLGACLWNQRRYEEAMVAIRRALDISPTYPRALANLGLIHSGLKQYILARKAFDDAVASDPEYLDARWDRSLLYLSLGEYEEGFREYETRIDRQRHLTYPHLANIPMWQGEDLTNKSIFVEVEQGIGDTILFSRFLPWLSTQARKVYFCCNQKLMALLWDYRECVEFLPPRVPLPEVDYYSYLASIPRWYGCTVDNIPPDPGYILSRTKYDRNIKLKVPSVTPHLKVGICWTGSPLQDRNDERSVPFRSLMALAENPCVALYSLQVGHGSDEIEKHAASGLVIDLNEQLSERGFTGTCEAILQCDLVITVCTSVAHMAGALNVPTWLLLCRDPYWPWLYSNRTDNLWYPSITLYRQSSPGDWSSIISQIKSDLSTLISSRFSNGK